MIRQDYARVHQTDWYGVTNLKLMTTNHGRQLRGSSSISDSLRSGEIRGEIAVKLSLAALPPRTRLSFEIFGALPKSSK
ncbi:hypothetical protein [Lapidilactobacillus achengensis]|uniref:hypothetical protein n=1 Tax=Lapidilactobacillus achengensis TaxID=2486000 RepID=UPI000F7B6452|nr:hypothetical protein [Lapidilactobacillus achengensis]